MKAAGSPVPALTSKSSSVSLSGNRHPILQESLPTSITDKWLKDTRFSQSSGLCDAVFSNLQTLETVTSRAGFTSRRQPSVVNTLQTMALDASRSQTVDD